MEAEASGSDREEAEQDDIEQHAPGGRRAGSNASSAAANGHRREGEVNADADVAVRFLLCLVSWSHQARAMQVSATADVGLSAFLQGVA